MLAWCAGGSEIPNRFAWIGNKNHANRKVQWYADQQQMRRLELNSIRMIDCRRYPHLLLENFIRNWARTTKRNRKRIPPGNPTIHILFAIRPLGCASLLILRCPYKRFGLQRKSCFCLASAAIQPTGRWIVRKLNWFEMKTKNNRNRFRLHSFRTEWHNDCVFCCCRQYVNIEMQLKQVGFV